MMIPSDEIMKQWQIRVLTDMMEQEFSLRGFDAASALFSSLDLSDDLYQELEGYLTKLKEEQQS